MAAERPLRSSVHGHPMTRPASSRTRPAPGLERRPRLSLPGSGASHPGLDPRQRPRPDPASLASNERLEFLGDRVLGLVVAELLYRRFADEPEGALAQRHAALVNGPTLSRVAERLRLSGSIVASRSEREAGGTSNPGILADTCEAIIGAMFLDGGLQAAAAFIEAQWSDLISDALTPPKDREDRPAGVGAGARHRPAELSRAEATTVRPTRRSSGSRWPCRGWARRREAAPPSAAPNRRRRRGCSFASTATGAGHDDDSPAVETVPGSRSPTSRLESSLRLRRGHRRAQRREVDPGQPHRRRQGQHRHAEDPDDAVSRARHRGARARRSSS